MVAIIGITGLKGSGKTTLANIIENDYNFKHLSFAGHLKDIVSQIFQWDSHLLDGLYPESREWREKPDEFWSEKLGRSFSPRRALQEFGTEIIRDSFNKNFWIYCVENKIRLNDYKRVVISDCRFPNEIDYIRSQNGLIIRVERGEKPSWWKLATDHNINKTKITKELEEIHPSERDWIDIDKPDLIIHNDYDLEYLTTLIKSIMKQYEHFNS